MMICELQKSQKLMRILEACQYEQLQYGRLHHI